MTTNFRTDIQGLRAIAVVSVVVFHYFPWILPGGFTGVDIFFVISGFLITLSLLKEMDRSPRTMITAFYRRRVRRLFPALFVLLGCCLIIGASVMFPPDLRDLALSAFSAAIFVSNFYFLRKSGYFAESSETMPLLHTWSLSIEEQFYILFPILLFLAGRYFRRDIFAIMVATTLVLFLSSEGIIWLRAPWGYYFTGARAFELAIGCALAVAPQSNRISKQTAHGIAVVGLVLILLGFALLSTRAHFPGVGALLPCIGAAAVLFARVHRDTAVGRLLSVFPMRFLGDISYSFYLWHWPPLAFLRYYFGIDLSVGTLLTTLAGSFFVSWLSYRYVEQPFARKLGHEVPYLGLGIGLIGVTSALSLAVVALHGLPQRFPVQINSLLEARNDFNPQRQRCHHGFRQKFEYGDACLFGQNLQGTKARVAVWGDSHGAELAYALGDGAQGTDFAVSELTASGCPPALGFAPDNLPECVVYNEKILRALLRDQRVKVVVLTVSIFSYKDRANLETGLSAALARLRQGGKQVIVILPIPTYSFDPPDRLARRAQSGSGLHNVGKSRNTFEAESASAAAFLTRISAQYGAQLFDPAPVFCDSQMCQLYRPEIGTLYFNGSHASLAAARVLAHRIYPIIEQALWISPGLLKTQVMGRRSLHKQED